MSNIIKEMRETSSTVFDLGPKFHAIAHAIQGFADRLEKSGALVPVPVGNRCLLRHAATDYVLADDGHIYQRDDGNWWSLLDKFQFLVGEDIFVQPVRLTPIMEADI